MNRTDHSPPLAVDLFAGPGGWDTGLAMLDQDLRVVGIEWDRWACRTGRAAGHVRVQADVARFDPTGIRCAHLLLGSPPCQAWSRSGKRKGILDQSAIFAHAMRVIAAGEWIDYADAGPLPAGEGDEGGTWHDTRSPLVLEVIRWVMAVQPANICLEQVPDVLPFWELIARWLRGQGYNVWAGCLSSERYGVPQTRERAIVIASRERVVSAPAATHTAYNAALVGGGRWHGTEGQLFGDGLEPWVSMADGLGWGFPDRPAPTVTAGGTEQGGVEVFSNAGTRRRLREVVAMGDVRQSNGTVRKVDEPAGTITASADNGNFRWVTPDGPSIRITVEESAVLQSFPADYPWHGRVGDKHRQVGDAVPPRLAAAVIGTCLGLNWQAAVAAHYGQERAA